MIKSSNYVVSSKKKVVRSSMKALTFVASEAEELAVDGWPDRPVHRVHAVHLVDDGGASGEAA